MTPYLKACVFLRKRFSVFFFFTLSLLALAIGRAASADKVRTAGSATTVATEGMIRYNTSTLYFEGYQGGEWVDLSPTRTIVKTANQSVTSSTTFVTDSELTYTLNANAKYQFEVFGYYDNNTGSSDNIRMRMTGPASPNFFFYEINIYGNNGDLGAGWSYKDYTSYTNPGVTTGRVSSSQPGRFNYRGTIETGASGGALAIQWTQNASNATAIRVLKGSYMKVTRLP